MSILTIATVVLSFLLLLALGYYSQNYYKSLKELTKLLNESRVTFQEQTALLTRLRLEQNRDAAWKEMQRIGKLKESAKELTMFKLEPDGLNVWKKSGDYEVTHIIPYGPHMRIHLTGYLQDMTANLEKKNEIDLIDKLTRYAESNVMTPEQVREQRESWIRGEMGMPETAQMMQPKEEE